MSGKPIVIKVGGEVVQGPHMAAIAADIAEMRAAGMPVVIVHGGGPQATELQKKLGQTPNIVAGRRITDAELTDLVSKGKTRRRKWRSDEGVEIGGRLVLDLSASREVGAARLEARARSEL